MLGACVLLEYLHMKDDNFRGTIASPLSILRNIQQLDFSSNELSGQVPKYFGNSPFLQYLILSFNDLEGEVPKEGVSKNASVISFLGNKKLCGGISELQQPNCPLNASEEGNDSFFIEPSNILLDNEMIAHVGDFGLAKLLCETGYSFSDDRSNSIAIKGSIGYVPPEYGLGGQISTQGDVYCNGILLLEMFIKRRPTDDLFKDGLNLHEFAKMALSTQLGEIVDPRLLLVEVNADLSNANGNYDRTSKIHECSVVGVACSLESPGVRMKIVDVVKKLQVVRDEWLNPL
ncbi:hypothetical protein AAC387_Pa01g0501 [Persea americana]